MNDMDHLVGRWTSVLYRFRKVFMSRKLEKYGIVGGMFMVLLTVNKFDGINQEQISDYLKIDKTTTAKAIKKLENGKFVRRETDSEDKRINRVYVTEQAGTILPEVNKALFDWEQVIRHGISDENYRITENTLHKMAENACRCIHENKE